MKLALIIASALFITGCATSPVVVQKEIVNVDRAVAFIPKPPTVPPFISQVDALSDNDITDPGKIGQAYKYDMTYLRAIVKVYEDILDQYRQSSVNFDKINEDIRNMTIPVAPVAPVVKK